MATSVHFSIKVSLHFFLHLKILYFFKCVGYVVSTDLTQRNLKMLALFQAVNWD